METVATRNCYCYYQEQLQSPALTETSEVTSSNISHTTWSGTTTCSTCLAGGGANTVSIISKSNEGNAAVFEKGAGSNQWPTEGGDTVTAGNESYETGVACPATSPNQSSGEGGGVTETASESCENVDKKGIVANQWPSEGSATTNTVDNQSYDSRVDCSECIQARAKKGGAAATPIVSLSYEGSNVICCTDSNEPQPADDISAATNDTPPAVFNATKSRMVSINVKTYVHKSDPDLERLQEDQKKSGRKRKRRHIAAASENNTSLSHFTVSHECRSFIYNKPIPATVAEESGPVEKVRKLTPPLYKPKLISAEVHIMPSAKFSITVDLDAYREELFQLKQFCELYGCNDWLNGVDQMLMLLNGDNLNLLNEDHLQRIDQLLCSGNTRRRKQLRFDEGEDDDLKQAAEEVQTSPIVQDNNDEEEEQSSQMEMIRQRLMAWTPLSTVRETSAEFEDEDEYEAVCGDDEDDTYVDDKQNLLIDEEEEDDTKVEYNSGSICSKCGDRWLNWSEEASSAKLSHVVDDDRKSASPDTTRISAQNQSYSGKKLSPAVLAGLACGPSKPPQFMYQIDEREYDNRILV